MKIRSIWIIRSLHERMSIEEYNVDQHLRVYVYVNKEDHTSVMPVMFGFIPNAEFIFESEKICDD